jgi:hypothetical protein
MIELLSETNIIVKRDSTTFSRGSSESSRRALLVLYSIDSIWNTWYWCHLRMALHPNLTFYQIKLSALLLRRCRSHDAHTAFNNHASIQYSREGKSILKLPSKRPLHLFGMLSSLSELCSFISNRKQLICQSCQLRPGSSCDASI